MNNITSRLTAHQIADFCLILVLASLAMVYLFDAYSASSHIMNLILILPVTILLLLLCLYEFVRQWISSQSLPASEMTGESDNSEIPQEETLEPLSTVMPVILMFIVYVLTLEWLGFDVGTFLFTSIFLRYHGETRWLWVIGYGFAFSLLTAIFFSMMLPYPMPMLILQTAY